MAIEVRELIESRSTGKEPGRDTTTRIFQVSPVTAELALDVAGVPVLDEALPWDDEQACVSLVADYWPGSYMVARVVAQYSSDGGTTWGGNNPSDPNFKSWTLSYGRVAQQIPYAVKDVRTFHYSSNGVEKFTTSYPVKEVNFWEARKKYIRRLRIRSFTADVMDQIISRQANKLHKIYGRWYLFVVGDVVEVSKNTWDVSYTWEYDPGTPEIPATDPAVTYALVVAPAWIVDPVHYPAAFWARPPFHQTGTIPFRDPTTGEISWPDWIATCPYQRDPIGWLSLPGFTL